MSPLMLGILIGGLINAAVILPELWANRGSEKERQARFKRIERERFLAIIDERNQMEKDFNFMPSNAYLDENEQVRDLYRSSLPGKRQPAQLRRVK